MIFLPRQVVIEEKALDYDLGKKLYQDFQELQIPLRILATGKRVSLDTGKSDKETYFMAKRTLVVGVRNNLSFQSCKPSAHYQLPLTSSCPGGCEYCYLMTNLGKRPYYKVYVNLKDILNRAQDYLEKRRPEVTLFEGSATSDPIPVERYTGALARCINFFGNQELALFRFVTKFTDVDSLLQIRHHGRTTFRFTLNTSEIISRYEHGTPSLGERLKAATKVARAGYPLGFIIGPVILYPGWDTDYPGLLAQIAFQLTPEVIPSFEIITHRFTSRAKKRILEVFPETTLPLNEEERKYKYGQFGYGKYVYPPEVWSEVKKVFQKSLQQYFPEAPMIYFV